jgi:hypothetical protein
LSIFRIYPDYNFALAFSLLCCYTVPMSEGNKAQPGDLLFIEQAERDWIIPGVYIVVSVGTYMKQGIERYFLMLDRSAINGGDNPCLNISYYTDTIDSKYTYVLLSNGEKYRG